MNCPACNEPFEARVWCPHPIGIYDVYYGAYNYTLIYMPNDLVPIRLKTSRIFDTEESIEKLLILR